jgi:CBS domain containing-hemolysin-like protein
MNGLLGAIIALLLLASAFISAAEASVFALGPSRIRTLTEEGFRGADALSQLHSRSTATRAALFVLDTLANLVCIGLAVALAGSRWGWSGAVPVVLGAPVGVLLIGELVPRALAARRSIMIALSTAPLLLALERLVHPLLSPFMRVEDLLTRMNGGDESTPEEREVRELADLGQREGVVEATERQLVERVFRLDELTAWDVMTPRVDVFALKDSQRLEDIIAELDDIPFSRVPVYGETIDDVTGILYVREAYRAYVGGKRAVRLSEISRDPFFVPGSVPLTRLLNDFQVRRLHMGIVADEFGGTDGLVTLEDVLEELVGEIEDEMDVQQEPLIRVSRNEVVADGSIDLREINYALHVSLPILESRSLNGLILDELGRVPERGETIQVGNLHIEILDATDTQVLRTRLKRVHAPSGGSEGSA